MWLFHVLGIMLSKRLLFSQDIECRSCRGENRKNSWGRKIDRIRGLGLLYWHRCGSDQWLLFHLSVTSFLSKNPSPIVYQRETQKVLYKCERLPLHIQFDDENMQNMISKWEWNTACTFISVVNYQNRMNILHIGTFSVMY